MDAITTLLTLTDLYGQRCGIDRKTASWRIFGDSKKLDALSDGRDIQVRRFEGALTWLSSNWPVDLAWPADVSRPQVNSPDVGPSVVAPAPDPGAEKSLAVFSPAEGAA